MTNSKRSKAIVIVVTLLALVGLYYKNLYMVFNVPKLFEMPLKTYVINLDRTPKRYEEINNELNKYNISHERFSAVDGYKIKIENIKTGEIFTGKELQENLKKIDPSLHYLINCPNIRLTYIPRSISGKLPDHITDYMTAGEFGVYCSNVEIWKEIVDKKTEYALILEDDAELDDDFAEKLEQVLHSQPKDWDVTYLFLGKQKGKKFIPVPNNDLLLKIDVDNKGISAAVAMLVSYTGAKKLLNYTKTFSFPIDMALSDVVNADVISAYVTKSFLVNASVNIKKSTIHEMGRAYKWQK